MVFSLTYLFRSGHYCFLKVTIRGARVGRILKNMRNENNDALDVSGNALGYPWANSIEALSNADVLLAADVVYDIDSIPDLVATVRKLLRQVPHHPNGVGNERVAIFTTTFRNTDTFALFEKELEEKNAIVAYRSQECLPAEHFPLLLHATRPTFGCAR